MELTLYYAPTSCSLAPMVALEETGLAYASERIDLGAGEQRSADYLAVNPEGRVPALVVDGTTVTEVPALLNFIAALAPEAGLVPPAGTIDQARCQEWLGFLSSGLHVTYAQFRRPERFLDTDAPGLGALSEAGLARTIEMFRKVERRIVGPWAAGSTYSLADIYLLPFHGWAWRLDLDIEKECPRWSAIVRAAGLRPAVGRALARHV